MENNQDATNIFLLKGSKRNARTKREICSKLIIKIPEQHQWRECKMVPTKKFSYFLFQWKYIWGCLGKKAVIKLSWCVKVYFWFFSIFKVVAAMKKIWNIMFCIMKFWKRMIQLAGMIALVIQGLLHIVSL